MFNTLTVKVTDGFFPLIFLSVFIYKTEHAHWRRPFKPTHSSGLLSRGKPCPVALPAWAGLEAGLRPTQVRISARWQGRPGKAAVGAGQVGKGAASAFSLRPWHQAHVSVSWDPGQALTG